MMRVPLGGAISKTDQRLWRHLAAGKDDICESPLFTRHLLGAAPHADAADVELPLSL